MRAITFSRYGDSSVLELGEAAPREPGPNEVRVRIHRAGVNPTDWKRRAGQTANDPISEPIVPGQDGAGEVIAVGAEVTNLQQGQRVWLWLAGACGPRCGTAQDEVTLPVAHVAPLPEVASFDLGASLGVPFLTAHRCLTITEGGPDQLEPQSLEGKSVLVAGGAGAVGNAAIQLGVWAGATVITTVSDDRKAALALAAGAHHVLNYREQDVAATVNKLVPEGVHAIVEVSPAANLEIDRSVLVPNGSIAAYAGNADDALTLPVRSMMTLNVRWQFVLLYGISDAAKRAAVAGVSAAVAAGAIRVGEDAGLPLAHFPLAETAAAHDAVADGAVGKVLIDVMDD